ncbi:hypothetical protein ACQ7B2_30965, partial [Escherichia coli]
NRDDDDFDGGRRRGHRYRDRRGRNRERGATTQSGGGNVDVEPTVTEDDVRAILDEARVAVHGLDGPGRASFCGLRVLPGGPGSTANARRET